jgi:hypothetical protein
LARPQDLRVGQTVEDVPTLATIFHHPLLPHDANVLGDVALGNTQRLYQLRNSALAASQGLHNAQPPWVGEGLADGRVQVVEAVPLVYWYHQMLDTEFRIS